MAINSISLNNEISNITSTKSVTQTTDTGSKNIQNQIASKQQRLNRISSDQEMSKEEKAKERQEIQKQIEELNRKLKLLRLEEQKEAEKAKKEQEQKVIVNEEMQTNPVQKEQDTNETTAQIEKERIEQLNAIGSNIHKILVADSTLQKNRIKNSVKMQKETTINIMESEIKMDELHGNENTAKKEELATLMNKTTFEIQDKKPPKTQKVSGMNENAKVIVVE